MNFFQTSTDIKRLIANFLDDKDIPNYCIINKNQYLTVCNEQFFKNILLQRYPDTLNWFGKLENRLCDTLEYRDISFKRWYLSIIYYVDLLNNEYGFNYKKYNKGNPKEQYEIFGKLNNKKNMNELLILASEKSELSLIKFALDNGANIHAYHDMALRWASSNGDLEIVRYLFEHGVNINVKDDYALQLASESGHLGVVKYLVEKGANIHTNADYPLRWASRKGHLEVVKYLVDQGANIHINTDYPLRWASQHGYLEVVKYLIEYGADINAGEVMHYD